MALYILGIHVRRLFIYVSINYQQLCISTRRHFSRYLQNNIQSYYAVNKVTVYVVFNFTWTLWAIFVILILDLASGYILIRINWAP